MKVSSIPHQETFFVRALPRSALSKLSAHNGWRMWNSCYDIFFLCQTDESSTNVHYLNILLGRVLY